MQIVAVGGSFAHEVHGVALWQPLPEGAVAALADAWARHGLLVFRRQSIDEDELAAFSARFGEPEAIVRTDWASPRRADVIYISNLRNDGGDPIGGLGSSELEWHTDQSYMAHPATGSLLHMVEKPPSGGATYWANLKLAYAGLPADLRKRADSATGIFSYAKRQAGYHEDRPLDENVRRRTPDVAHALVHVHPLTGERALYLDPSAMVGVVGMAGAQGRAFLAALAEQAVREEYVYRHDWQVGDLVMWDNGLLLHRRDAFDPSLNRLLKRTTLRLSPARHIVPRGARAVGHLPS